MYIHRMQWQPEAMEHLGLLLTWSLVARSSPSSSNLSSVATLVQDIQGDTDSHT